MLHVEGGKFICHTQGGMTNQSIDNAEVMAEVMGHKVQQSTVAVGFAGPIYRKSFELAFHSLLFILVSAAL